MKPIIAHAPHARAANSVQRIMATVMLALAPATLFGFWLYGWPAVYLWAVSLLAAIVGEAAALRFQPLAVKPALLDGSGVLTAWLLALSLPPWAPWWIAVVGSLFAVVVGKQVFGGLGQNVFNPAMVGYAVLLISFPAQMTSWPGLLALTGTPLTLADSAAIIFGDAPKAVLDAVTMATPLDTLRTGLLQQHTVDEIMTQPIFGRFGGTGFEWLAGAFLAGGLVLWALRIISWRVPLAFLAGVWLTAGFLHFFDAGRYGAPWFHLFAPSVMLGAFFIATDPVSGSTTPLGKLIFGFGAGVLTIIIRTWGGYPDGVAFAILLMNVAVPLIDQYTQPRIYGGAPGREKGSSR